MKAKLLALALGTAVSFGAAAGPVPSLTGGPLYLKFNGAEQISFGGASTWGNNSSLGATTAAQTADIAANASHAGEINWGVFTMTAIDIGAVGINHKVVTDTGTSVYNGPGLTTMATNNGQITGMVYGVQAGSAPQSSIFPATGGYIDLYWRDLSVYSKTNTSALDSDVRTGYNTASGYTDGTFLLRLKFDSGIDPLNAMNYISGNAMPTDDPDGFSGQANSYASVDTSATGAWTEKFDTNWFNTKYGDRDFKFRNNYETFNKWDGTPQSGIVGAILDDPGQAMALPEPGVLSLMGLAMLGMAVTRRRKSS